MDKKRCENITTQPISYIMQGQTDVSARVMLRVILTIGRI